MRQHKFNSREEYLEAQIKISSRRFFFRKKNFTVMEVVERIKEYWLSNYESSVKNGLCHGVGRGRELKIFKRAFHSGVWFGTEVVDKLCDGKRIFCRDFSEPVDEWLGRFDFIYSNSLDHARFPSETIGVWLQQLNKDGCLFVEWTPWHAKLGRGNNSADCFAATENEYRNLFEDIGIIYDALIVSKPEQEWHRTIFVVGKKECPSTL